MLVVSVWSALKGGFKATLAINAAHAASVRQDNTSPTGAKRNVSSAVRERQIQGGGKLQKVHAALVEQAVTNHRLVGHGAATVRQDATTPTQPEQPVPACAENAPRGSSDGEVGAAAVEPALLVALLTRKAN